MNDENQTPEQVIEPIGHDVANEVKPEIERTERLKKIDDKWDKIHKNIVDFQQEFGIRGFIVSAKTLDSGIIYNISPITQY